MNVDKIFTVTIGTNDVRFLSSVTAAHPDRFNTILRLHHTQFVTVIIVIITYVFSSCYGLYRPIRCTPDRTTSKPVSTANKRLVGDAGVFIQSFSWGQLISSTFSGLKVCIS